MVVLSPPEWMRRRGPVQNIKNAVLALGRALRDAWVLTRRRLQPHWRVAVLLELFLGIAFLVLAADPGPGDTPKVVTAFAIPAFAFLLLGLAFFLAALLWAPIRDHRKLLSEIETGKQATEDTQKQLDYYARSHDLIHRAHNWVLWVENELRVYQGAAQRGDAFDPEGEWRRVRDRVEQIANELREVGQPRMAEEWEEAAKVSRPPETATEFAKYVQQQLYPFTKRCELFTQQFPPFEGKPITAPPGIKSPYPLP